MSTKFNYENFTITVDFKNDFALSMTVSDNFTNDYFINEAVELTKIKRDTILATLARKNEQNLKCQFNIVDIEPKKLILSFIVSFDFLPTFTEFITLDQIEQRVNGFNKVESAELRSDIEELQKLLNLISSDSCTYVIQNTFTFSPKGQILSKQLPRGSYMLQVSGLFVCSNGSVCKNDLIFTIEYLDQQFKTVICTHTNGSYGYPYSFRKDIVINDTTTLKISADNRQQQSISLNNNIVNIVPMLLQSSI